MDIITIICAIFLILVVLLGSKFAVLFGMLQSLTLVIVVALLIIGILLEIIIIKGTTSVPEKVLCSIAHIFLTAIIVLGSYKFFGDLISVDTSDGLCGIFNNFLESIGVILAFCVYIPFMFAIYVADLHIVGIDFE